MSYSLGWHRHGMHLIRPMWRGHGLVHYRELIPAIITAYLVEKMSDDHPYIWRYTALYGPKGLVIFDHPYNGESVRLACPVLQSGFVIQGKVDRGVTGVALTTGGGHPMIVLRDKTRQRGGRRSHRRRPGMPEKLHGALRGLLAPVFAQARSRLTAFAYISALLAGRGDRKSCWQLAEAAGHASPTYAVRPGTPSTPR